LSYSAVFFSLLSFIVALSASAKNGKLEAKLAAERDDLGLHT
jgi:hypothetical protein